MPADASREHQTEGHGASAQHDRGDGAVVRGLQDQHGSSREDLNNAGRGAQAGRRFVRRGPGGVASQRLPRAKPDEPVPLQRPRLLLAPNAEEASA